MGHHSGSAAGEDESDTARLLPSGAPAGQAMQQYYYYYYHYCYYYCYYCYYCYYYY